MITGHGVFELDDILSVNTYPWSTRGWPEMDVGNHWLAVDKKTRLRDFRSQNWESRPGNAIEILLYLMLLSRTSYQPILAQTADVRGAPVDADPIKLMAKI